MSKIDYERLANLLNEDRKTLDEMNKDELNEIIANTKDGLKEFQFHNEETIADAEKLIENASKRLKEF